MPAKKSGRTEKARRIRLRQKRCRHEGERRVEEIGQGCGFGLVCRNCDLVIETSPTNIYG